VTPVKTVWRWTAGFGRFWYGFIIGDDWVAAAGVLVMLGAAYGLLRLRAPAWWAGPVVVTITLLVTLRRARRGTESGGELEHLDAGRRSLPRHPAADV
jgi:hypothetical protein